MHAHVRFVFVVLGACSAFPALASTAVCAAARAAQSLALAQTATLTVAARNTTAGGIGRVELAPAVDVAPPGPGPEDLPASAPTAPAIACRSDGTGTCSGAATIGTTVILQAVDVSNSTFVSWVGCSSQTPVTGGFAPRCNVSMSGARSVTAWFKPAGYTLTASTSPVPSGSFVPDAGGRLQAPSNPAIDCRTGDPAYPACSGRVAIGAAITITAVPWANSRVTSWGGCTPIDATTCRISAMSSNLAVSATFGVTSFKVTGIVSGVGTITAPAGGAVLDGMSCPTDCEATVSAGGSVTLTPTPGTGQEFVSWIGCVSPTTSCTITNVQAAGTVTATFRAAQCSSCHGIPPPSPHVARADCGTCHPGYTSTSIVPGLHMNGVVDPTHASTLGNACTTDPNVQDRCAVCHPCFAP